MRHVMSWSLCISTWLLTHKFCTCRGWVVFTGLRDRLVASSPPQQLPIDVLNGIFLGTVALSSQIYGWSESISNNNLWVLFLLAGIAWDSVGERLFITGKCWRELYEVKTEVTKLQMSATEHLEVQKMCRVAL